jgi:hypothetical protein
MAAVEEEPVQTEAEKLQETAKKVSEKYVADKVMEILGTPPDFISCVAKKINMSWYRVNVRCKKKTAVEGMITLAEIRHSYFLRCLTGDFVEGDVVEPVYTTV